MENLKIVGFAIFFTKTAFMENQFYRHPTHFVKMGHKYSRWSAAFPSYDDSWTEDVNNYNSVCLTKHFLQ